MELKEIMSYKSFAVVGNTIREDKTAKKIKDNLEYFEYTVYPVYKEIKSLNDIDGEIDVIDLCINPVLGLNYLKECNKPYKCVLIQPGAESDEIKEFLDSKGIPYLEGCALVGMSLFKGKLKYK